MLEKKWRPGFAQNDGFRMSGDLLMSMASSLNVGASTGSSFGRPRLAFHCAVWLDCTLHESVDGETIFRRLT